MRRKTIRGFLASFGREGLVGEEEEGGEPDSKALKESEVIWVEGGRPRARSRRERNHRIRVKIERTWPR